MFRRSFGSLLSLLAILHVIFLSSPAYAQAPGKKPTPAAQPQDLIARGQAQFEEQQYEESIQTLSGALLKPNNTPAQKVEIYRLLALNYITIGRKDEAENAVRGLLVQQPDYEIPAKESPRFRDFFAAARTRWEAEGRPGLAKDEPAAKTVILRHGSPTQVEPQKALELHAKLVDTDGRTGSVKLWFRVGTKGDFADVKATVAGDSVTATIPGDSVKPPVIDYYFEVFDGAGTIIASRGDSSSPLRVAVQEGGSKGWVLPVAIGGSVLGAAAIVGILALAGVFKGSSSSNPSNGKPVSTVSVNVGDTAIHFR